MQILFVAIVLFLMAALPAADRLNPNVLAQAKAATAFIKAGDGTGSGFLCKVEARSGWVVTNAHVVDPAITAGKPIVVVLGSGTGKDREIPALVSGVDRERDLAVLRIEGDALPKPLLVKGQTETNETMPVWVLGFPFGQALSVGNQNPAPTITSTEITSVRKNDWNVREVIQTAGGINPGNSGGPIINQRGELVAISVAKVTGTDIAFGIPVNHLEETLGGRSTLLFSKLTVRDGKAEFDLRLEFVDPFSTVTKVVVLVGPADKIQGSKPVCDNKGYINGPIVGGMQEYPMEYLDSSAKSVAEYKLPVRSSPGIGVQFRYHRKGSRVPFFTNAIILRDAQAGDR